MSIGFLLILFALSLIGITGGLLTRFVKVIIGALGVAGIFSIAKAIRSKGESPDEPSTRKEPRA